MNSISGFTSQMRLTGLSGFDTESMVSELMKAERIPLDALRQRRTLVEWKREAYRDVTNSLKGFQTKFFDIVNRPTYLLSENSIRPMKAKTDSNTYVTASATTDAKAGTSTIKVLQLATADSSVSSGNISKDISGTISARNLADKKILVTLDGVTKEIALKDYTSFTDNDMAADIQNSLATAFGSSKLQVSIASGNISIGAVTGSGVTNVTLYQPSDGTGGLTGLGLSSGVSNRITLKSTLGSLSDSLGIPMTFSAGGTVDFKINGKYFSAQATDTLQEVFDKINNSSEANAQISYDEITDKITLVSKHTGAGDNLKLETISGTFFEALKIDTAAPTAEGHDAKVLINGSIDPIVRSTNNFTVNGISYTLNKEHDVASTGETITVSQETDSVVATIKSFIDEYNKLIDSLNGKAAESHDRDYLPLTDEQKEAMKEEDIEKWEKQAKKGLLRNDSILQNITLSMRKALYEKVEGVGLSLKDIGIQSMSYTDNGKLYLDEDKLKTVLLDKPGQVAKLLNGVSLDNPIYSRNLTSEQRKDRYIKSGVFQRLSDIIEDNISSVRNSSDKKGILLEKAGIEGDLSNTKNLLNDELNHFDDRIDDLIDKLTRKEENYYRKFSNLESMLSRMNQQSAWISSQFGGGQ